MASICPKCHTENRADSKFCSNCAAPLRPEGIDGASLTKTLVTPPPVVSKDALIAGKYKIIEELGRGGMGIVYRAEDTRLKRTVALKFLPPELIHIPDIKDRFRREAQAAAALDHPNICTVYEFDQTEERAFISMAYIEGQSLRKKTESGPLEFEEALKIAVQVAEGLQEAHERGMYENALEQIKAYYESIDIREGIKALTIGYEKGGYRGAMKSAAEMWEELAKVSYVLPWNVAQVYVYAGNKEKTLDWLEKGVDVRDANMLIIGVTPLFVDLLKDEPRYHDLLRKMNLEAAVKD